jgi:hypothetical protein
MRLVDTRIIGDGCHYTYELVRDAGAHSARLARRVSASGVSGRVLAEAVAPIPSRSIHNELMYIVSRGPETRR